MDRKCELLKILDSYGCLFFKKRSTRDNSRGQSLAVVCWNLYKSASFWMEQADIGLNHMVFPLVNFINSSLCSTARYDVLNMARLID